MEKLEKRFCRFAGSGALKRWGGAAHPRDETFSRTFSPLVVFVTGWTTEDGTLRDPNGLPFQFTILINQGDTETQSVASLYIEALQRLGMRVDIEATDNAQFTERSNSFDFDMTYFRRDLSLSPGNEQRFYWGSQSAETPGSRNLMGLQSPAVDALIDSLLTATSREDFIAVVRALDRVLTSGRHVIPFWQFNVGRIAHVKELKHPEQLPV